MSAYDAVEGVRFGSFHNLSLSNRRRPDGTRPFKLVEAEPLQTSYGPVRGYSQRAAAATCPYRKLNPGDDRLRIG
jgi:hypothetical protein